MFFAKLLLICTGNSADWLEPLHAGSEAAFDLTLAPRLTTKTLV